MSETANEQIDLSTINFTPLDEAAAEGKKKPIPTGLKIEEATIEDMTAYPAHPKSSADYSLRLKLVPAEGSSYTNVIYLSVAYTEGKDPHPKSTMFAVNAAVWPNVDDRVGKVPTDWIGERVSILTVPDTNPDGEPYTKIIPMPLGS